VHFDELVELLIEAEADEHGAVAVNLQLGALAKLFRVFDRERVQPQDRGQLVDDLAGRVLDVQPEGLACLNELLYQRQGGIPNDLAGMINPAPHGSQTTPPLAAPRPDGSLTASPAPRSGMAGRLRRGSRTRGCLADCPKDPPAVAPFGARSGEES
jgi:hypothetical protein